MAASIRRTSRHGSPSRQPSTTPRDRFKPASRGWTHSTVLYNGVDSDHFELTGSFEAGKRMRAPSTVLVHVLGDVGEMREVAERANDVEHLRDRQRIEQPRERNAMPIGAAIGRAAKADRRLPDGLDPLEARITQLRAQHVAKHAAKEPRVFLQR